MSSYSPPRAHRRLEYLGKYWNNMATYQHLGHLMWTKIDIRFENALSCVSTGIWVEVAVLDRRGLLELAESFQLGGNKPTLGAVLHDDVARNGSTFVQLVTIFFNLIEERNSRYTLSVAATGRFRSRSEKLPPLSVMGAYKGVPARRNSGKRNQSRDTHENRDLTERLLCSEVFLGLLFVSTEVNRNNFKWDFQLLECCCNGLRAGWNDTAMDFENHISMVKSID